MVSYWNKHGDDKMATITVKNIPDDLYKKLKENASINRRSINREVIYCIENTVKSRKIDTDEFITQIDNFYRDKNIPLLTDTTLKEFKERGRL